MSVRVLSDTRCLLGEGAFWHPDRGTFMWCDILEMRLYEASDAGERHWQFDRYVSAMGRVDADRVLLATSTDIILFDLETGDETRLTALEEDDPTTRSNDGRADPQGGFWIGTMGLQTEPGAGAIYRYAKGELRSLFPGITVPNAICFAPDGRSACFTDTIDGIIRRVSLDADGWPDGAPEPWLDLGREGMKPDGAVIDADGNFWNAQWESGRVACYAPDGTLRDTIAIPADRTTCPAFGGPDMSTLIVTSAAIERPECDQAGRTFATATQARGQVEPIIRL